MWIDLPKSARDNGETTTDESECFLVFGIS